MPSLPTRDGVYLAHENCPDTFELFNYDHPSMLYALGVLPDDPSVDRETMRRTCSESLRTGSGIDHGVEISLRVR